VGQVLLRRWPPSRLSAPHGMSLCHASCTF